MRVRRGAVRRALPWALLAAALWPCAACAEPFPIDPALGVPDARARSDVLRDPGGRWDVADILARQSLFRPTASLSPDLAVSAFAPVTLWFRLQPRSEGAGPWFLEVSPDLERAEAILIEDDGRVSRTRLGMRVPAASRVPPLPGTMALLPDGAMRGGTLYVRMVGPEEQVTRLGLRPAAWEATEGRWAAEDVLLPRVALIGLVGGLGLFHLVLGLTLREGIYLRYAAATASFALYTAADCRMAWRWLWPTLALPYDGTVSALYALYLALNLGFARAFLDPAGLQRGWRVAWAAWWAEAAFQALNTLYPNLLDATDLMPVLDPLLSGSLFAAILACGVAPCHARRPGAFAYMAAFCGVSLGLLVKVLGDNRVIAQTPWNNTASALGVAWEALFLAAVMGRRLLLLRAERDRLAALALTDALTGIANRRSFDLRLAEEWRRAARGGTRLSVVMFDVDRFKAYNDGFGHAAGDGVLRHVAMAAAQALERGEDFLARYGGEEFVAVLPGVAAAEATAAAEKIRLAVHALQLPHPDGDVGCVTLSGGVASGMPGQGFGEQDLLRAADSALYEAKHAGRDRVRVAAPPTRTGAGPAPRALPPSAASGPGGRAALPAPCLEAVSKTGPCPCPKAGPARGKLLLDFAEGSPLASNT